MYLQFDDMIAGRLDDVDDDIALSNHIIDDSGSRKALRAVTLLGEAKVGLARSVCGSRSHVTTGKGSFEKKYFSSLSS